MPKIFDAGKSALVLGATENTRFGVIAERTGDPAATAHLLVDPPVDLTIRASACRPKPMSRMTALPSRGKAGYTGQTFAVELGGDVSFRHDQLAGLAGNRTHRCGHHKPDQHDGRQRLAARRQGCDENQAATDNLLLPAPPLLSAVADLIEKSPLQLQEQRGIRLAEYSGIQHHLGDPATSDSIFDRVLQIARRFDLDGESLRKAQARVRLAEATQEGAA